MSCLELAEVGGGRGAVVELELEALDLHVLEEGQELTAGLGYRDRGGEGGVLGALAWIALGSFLCLLKKRV